MKSLKEFHNLNGKVAIINGAAGNLGIVHAEALAELGCNIALTDIREEKAQEIAKEISDKYNIKAIGLKIDLFQKETIQETFKKIFEQLGRIDILINNAQYSPPEDIEPVETFDKDVWDKVMAINVTGTFLSCQQVEKYMTNGGTILNMGSIMGVIAPDRRIYEGSTYEGKTMNSPLVYSTSKAAIIGLTRYLAVDWAKKNIRVNCISAAGFESGQTDLFKSKYQDKIPMARMANKEELKGAIIYLCSEASSFVTGHNLILDGGMSSW
ncbi:SDR family oxidoreductase [Candidatus Woesearchaeota archaeon]|jgi:NAD(P)-dependent dehydrogenase (short-subunit alcohol dehydrogenase family)|nr:SDR family oxidoreductase [Candidatus Woesearchaeota archaeon]